MKKVIFSAIVIASLLSSNSVLAQDGGAYVKVNAGYNFATSKMTFASNVTENSTTSSTFEANNFSFGKGLNFGGAFGYNFNKNVGLELGVNYLLGGESKSTNKELNGDTNETVVKAKMLQLRPTLVISAGMDQINPYAKFGVLLASGSFTATENETFAAGSSQNVEEFKGGMQLGFQGGVGAEFKLTDKLGFYGELNLTSLSYSPDESEITKSETKIGSVITNNLTGEDVIDIKTEYVDSITTSTTAPDRNSPAKELKRNFAFGSVGLNVGVKYNF